MMANRKKPGVALWATVVVAVMLVGYPLSFGPACWIVDKLPPSIDEGVCRLYGPLSGHAVWREHAIGRALWWWPTCFRSDGAAVFYIRDLST